MTNEEAIMILHGLRMSYICDPNECSLEERDDNNFWCKSCDEHHEALAMAIEAIEKLDKIAFIVSFETGNRHEIEDKVLKVIRGEEQ